MTGDPKVLEVLNEALRDELSAINQYFFHAQMSENWGYKKYSHSIKMQSIDEMRHAEALMERILLLGGLPSMEPRPICAGKSVKEMIDADLKHEKEAIAKCSDAIRLCADKNDDGSRDLFADLLKDDERHQDWLELQIDIIEQIGYERYLVTQAGQVA